MPPYSHWRRLKLASRILLDLFQKVLLFRLSIDLNECLDRFTLNTSSSFVDDFRYHVCGLIYLEGWEGGEVMIDENCGLIYLESWEGGEAMNQLFDCGGTKVRTRVGFRRDWFRKIAV